MSLIRLPRPLLLLTRISQTNIRTLNLAATQLDAIPGSFPKQSISTDPKTYIQSQLKLALRAKDTPRLNVLRSILASVTNASHTPSPITTSSHLYNLLSKQISASQKAIEEFEQAKRKDLEEKERKQVEILEEYRNGIESLKSNDIDEILMRILDDIKAKGAGLKFGDVMKEAQKAIAGRPHDSQYLIDKIKSVVKS